MKCAIRITYGIDYCFQANTPSHEIAASAGSCCPSDCGGGEGHTSTQLIKGMPMLSFKKSNSSVAKGKHL
eukprot:scaffold871_cov130-Cylindrotheca_fusiformis.AAC.27